MAKRYPAQLSGGQRQRVGVARALAADPPLMLMDEPFGAIDPINRDRLQNEFLRLQAEIRKTIVFVTHDIDEAIKMGDRIAILQVGGKLAQYATPAELLLHPANEFVEDFVGADRALKRLRCCACATSTSGAWRWSARRAGRESPPDRGRRHRHPAAVDDDGRRAAGCRARATGERCARSCAPGPSRRRARRHPARRASTCSRTARCTAAVVDDEGKAVGALIDGAARATAAGARVIVAARPAPDPRPRRRTTSLRRATTASARAGSPTTSTATRRR